jgi:uncharacterized protein (DUF1800 family)
VEKFLKFVDLRTDDAGGLLTWRTTTDRSKRPAPLAAHRIRRSSASRRGADGLGSIAAAVADMLAVATNPPSVQFTAPADRNWERGQDLTHFWLDQMARDSNRPFQERLAFFWHGHFCSEFGKVGSATLMREQIDLWRREGLGDIGSLATTMSTQVAMIRYLDNNQNKKSSPNQNFARELMELFLLGVGNYSEADVESATAAWTGHSDQWNDDVSPYRWRADWHDASRRTSSGAASTSIRPRAPGQAMAPRRSR